MSEKPVVHVVDDDVSFLRSVTRLLRASGYKVEAYSSVDEFLQRPSSQAPGCVLTDLQMPHRSGLDLQKALARTRHALPVIFLTAKGDIPTSVRAMREGAEDFLTKRAPKAALFDAIERAIARSLREEKRRSCRAEARAKFDALSRREWEVLAGVLRGLLNKQIAEKLGIAERTVKHHRTSLTNKVGVSSAAEMALLVNEAGLDRADIPAV
ncbi:MAG: response regulator transcription factor [Chthoniobacterales bacterium]|nr:response regulator transcription factor [Chthoniobacterales bacterium]